MDLLTYTIDRIQMSGQIICQAHGHAPWGLSVDDGFQIPFYYLQSGWCLLIHEDGEQIRLHQGDLIFITSAQAHRLCDANQSQSLPLVEWNSNGYEGQSPVYRSGGEGMKTQILCGTYRLEQSMLTELLFSTLPKQLHLSAGSSAVRQRVEPILGLLLTELEQELMGGYRFITQCLDLLLIRALRAWISVGIDAELGWLNAMRHPAISFAVTSLLQNPEHAWTVEELADEVQLSRASLTREFQRFVGQGPMSFLTMIRMELAARLLVQEGEAVSDVSELVGYRSEQSFNRAFKKYFDVPPGRYRKTLDQV